MSIDIQITAEQVGEPAIHAHAVKKSYGDVHVLRGVVWLPRGAKADVRARPGSRDQAI